MPTPTFNAIVDQHPDDDGTTVKMEKETIDLTEGEAFLETPPSMSATPPPPEAIKPHRQKAFRPKTVDLPPAMSALPSPATPEVDIYQLFQVIGAAFAIG